jgi:threonine/homoserine/homoserine lactone efflux protein
MSELLPLLSYCLLMSLTPGPNNVMLTASGARHGYRGALPLMLGINAGVAAQTALACLGLGGLVSLYPALQQGLRLAGALYLLWLAWRLGGLSLGEAPAAARPPGFWQGVLFQAVNPKSWIKALTLGSVFLPAGLTPPLAALLVAGLGSLIALPCNSVWALFGVAIGRHLRSRRRQRWFGAAMGASLALLALRLLCSPLPGAAA